MVGLMSPGSKMKYADHQHSDIMQNVRSHFLFLPMFPWERSNHPPSGPMRVRMKLDTIQYDQK